MPVWDPPHAVLAASLEDRHECLSSQSERRHHVEACFSVYGDLCVVVLFSIWPQMHITTAQDGGGASHLIWAEDFGIAQQVAGINGAGDALLTELVGDRMQELRPPGMVHSRVEELDPCAEGDEQGQDSQLAVGARGERGGGRGGEPLRHNRPDLAFDALVGAAEVEGWHVGSGRGRDGHAVVLSRVAGDL